MLKLVEGLFDVCGHGNVTYLLVVVPVHDETTIDKHIGRLRHRQVGSRHERRLGGERAKGAETCGGPL